jgi:hypothetical protein
MMLGKKVTKSGTSIRNSEEEKRSDCASGPAVLSHWSPEEINEYLAEKYPRRKLVMNHESKN